MFDKFYMINTILNEKKIKETETTSKRNIAFLNGPMYGRASHTHKNINA